MMRMSQYEARPQYHHYTVDYEPKYVNELCPQRTQAFPVTLSSQRKAMMLLDQDTFDPSYFSLDTSTLPHKKHGEWLESVDYL